MQSVTILGATGSIGKSTLDVISSHPEKYSLFALTANDNIDAMRSLCERYLPEYAVLADVESANELKRQLGKLRTEVLGGVDSLEWVSRESKVDTVVAAIVGAAGLLPTLAAVKTGKKVLLANKESLVMSGKLFMDAVVDYKATLLPVDSEHNAIFQCLPQNNSGLESKGVRKIYLTGSGGPFRSVAASELDYVTPDQACAHPNWSMGRKISVDSATMMNKGLEFIEACWLFDASDELIEILVHPQSVVHSMVEFIDGSVLAQLGNPDMRTPIAHCLAWPERISSNATYLDFTKLNALTFELPDLDKFTGLKLSLEVVKRGGTYSIALNAANEVAVNDFLNNKIKFTQITEVIQKVLDSWDSCEPDSIDVVLNADKEARIYASEVSSNLHGVGL